MKILHTADLHIDSPLTSHLSADKVRERRAELFSTFSAMVESAAECGIKIMIIAGDLFDSDKITKTARKRTLALLAAHKEISFFYLPGNHEEMGLIAGEDALPENLFLFSKDWSYFASGDLVIAGRSSTSQDMFETLSLPADKRNIVVLHGELRDRSDEGGVIGRRDAVGRNIDYLALGHYHSYSAEKIDDRCTAVYAGTPEGRGFDELGDKGFVLLDSSEAGITHRFVPFARRRLHEVEVDLTDAADLYELERRAASALSAIPDSDLTRLMITGYRQVGFSVDTAALMARFGRNFYYFEVKDESRLKISAADYERDLSLKGEFIRLVRADTTLSDKKKEEIIACGLAALLGEGMI